MRMPQTWLSRWIVVLVLAAIWIVWETGPSGRLQSAIQAQQDTWTTDTARRMGIRLAETRDASGSPAYPVQAGDLLFFTNASGSFGAKNTLDAVVVVDAKTRKPVGMSNIEPDWAEGYVSHGITVSPDGKYVYLPSISPGDGTRGKNPSRLLVLDARTLKISQIIVSGGERPHHAKLFVDHTGASRVLVEDFNWSDNSGNGKGFFILDHTDHNKVLGGMLPGQFRGNPYAGFTSPDGRYIYYGMPAPDRRIRGDMVGWVAKVDMQTMKVAQAIPLDNADPIWTVFSKDGKYAWVSQAGHDGDSKITKIERATDPKGMDKVVGESPAGPGVYGLALTLDGSEIWTADKGEGTSAAKRRTTVTVVDADKMFVKRTIETGCRINDHLIMSPDGGEMWAMCNGSQEIVVLDVKSYAVKGRIPMPNQGAVHGGTFVSYSSGPGGAIVAEAVSDQNGLQGSARTAYMQGKPWVPPTR